MPEKKTLEYIKNLGDKISQLVIQIGNLNEKLENLIKMDVDIKKSLIDMMKCESELKLLTELDKLGKSSDDNSEDEEVKKITENRINNLKLQIFKYSSDINKIVDSKETDSGKRTRRKSRSKKKSPKKTNKKRSY